MARHGPPPRAASCGVCSAGSSAPHAYYPGCTGPESEGWAPDASEELARRKARALLEEFRAMRQERDSLRDQLAARDAEVSSLRQRLAEGALRGHAESEAQLRSLHQRCCALDSEVQVLREGRKADKQKIRELTAALGDSALAPPDPAAPPAPPAARNEADSHSSGSPQLCVSPGVHINAEGDLAVCVAPAPLPPPAAPPPPAPSPNRPGRRNWLDTLTPQSPSPAQATPPRSSPAEVARSPAPATPRGQWGLSAGDCGAGSPVQPRPHPSRSAGSVPLFRELEDAYRRLQSAEGDASRLQQLEQQNAALRRELTDRDSGGSARLAAAEPHPLRMFHLELLPGTPYSAPPGGCPLIDPLRMPTVWDLLPKRPGIVLLAVGADDSAELVNTSWRAMAHVKLSTEVGGLSIAPEARGVQTEECGRSASFVAGAPPRTARPFVAGQLAGAVAVVTLSEPVLDEPYRAAQREMLRRRLLEEGGRPACEGALFADPDFRPPAEGPFGWGRPLPHERLVSNTSADLCLRQGELADNCLVSCISALLWWRLRPHDWMEAAEWLEAPSLARGAVAFRLYDRRMQQRVVVDTLLPRLGEAPAYARGGDCSLLWAPLLEKACAKLKGGYEALCRGPMQTPQGCLSALTPLRMHDFLLEGASVGLLAELVTWVMHRHLVLLVPRPEDAKLGADLPQLTFTDLYIVTGCSARQGGDAQLQPAMAGSPGEGEEAAALVVVPRSALPRLFSGGCVVFARSTAGTDPPPP
eukprot:TRINITY_DN3894_c3_g1_i1.p1 TRINITY_DN3894_c3_g1~~TRINITY_DN3894_c3_g1_i1.p1  ORF type:complete len:755 (+),score=182.63 TRINITY_DN3894_c3_g1_i1:72-2336(+)